MVVDEVSLQQVLLNLVRNAVEATAERGGGTVTLKTSADSETVTISVHDEGPGVSEDLASRILSPFFTTKAGGMGVGLALCQRLVEADSGRLRFQNNKPGPGATFRVEFPAARSGGDAP